MKITKKLENRVKAGIAFLNVARPNWLKEIDLNKLDLAGPNTCIIGEVYGNYKEGINELGLRASSAETLGFAEFFNDSPSLSENPELRIPYRKLTAAWKEMLKPLLKK